MTYIFFDMYSFYSWNAIGGTAHADFWLVFNSAYYYIEVTNMAYGRFMDVLKRLIFIFFSCGTDVWSSLRLGIKILL